MHTHTNPWGRIQWLNAITMLTAHFMCGLMSDLVICKFQESMVILDTKCPYWGVINQHKPKPISFPAAISICDIRLILLLSIAGLQQYVRTIYVLIRVWICWFITISHWRENIGLDRSLFVFSSFCWFYIYIHRNALVPKGEYTCHFPHAHKSKINITPVLCLIKSW